MLVILLVLCCVAVDATLVKVKVEQGWLEGQIVSSSIGKENFYSFKGIPYARPPIGKLRFKAPQPPLKWNGTRNAIEHGSVCVQYQNVASKTMVGDEDCLFLNVYSPNVNPSTPLPVMFYIHGGLFRTGSGNDDFYAPDFLMDRGVILVTINYRLGALGFLSVNNKEASGNAGLKDQIAALRWVKRNIEHFGGDPNRVTIFGDSAGGSSVTLHILSPAAKGLYQRAIVMSGVYSKDFGIVMLPEQRAFVLGRKLGVETNDTNILIKYLRNVSAKDIIAIQPNVLFADQAAASLLTLAYFTPVVEKKFEGSPDQYLTECPLTLMNERRVNRADVFIGHTTQEGLRVASLLTEPFLEYFPNYKEFLVPYKISYCQSPKQVLKLAEKLQNYYFGDQPISLKTIKELVTYYSYARYVYEIHAFIERLPKFQSRKRYFYAFEIYSERNIYAKAGAMKFGIRQATHQDDLGYLFDGSGYNVTVDVNGEVYKYVQLMTTLYTNFAKFGTPTPDESLGLIWPQYDPGRNYVKIGETGNLTTGTIFYKDGYPLAFWKQLYSSVGIYL